MTQMWEIIYKTNKQSMSDIMFSNIDAVSHELNTWLAYLDNPRDITEIRNNFFVAMV